MDYVALGGLLIGVLGALGGIIKLVLGAIREQRQDFQTFLGNHMSHNTAAMERLSEQIRLGLEESKANAARTELRQMEIKQAIREEHRGERP